MGNGWHCNGAAKMGDCGPKGSVCYCDCAPCNKERGVLAWDAEYCSDCYRVTAECKCGKKAADQGEGTATMNNNSVQPSSPIAEYLRSPQARSDVSMLLATKSPYRMIWPTDGIRRTMRLKLAGTWLEVSISGEKDSDRPFIFAYILPRTDRFVISDLGHGVRTYAMRTGEYGGPRYQDFHCGMAEAVSCWPAGSTWHDGAIWADGEERSNNPHIGLGIKANDLPDAICRVMLASLRVANLGLVP